MYVRSTLFRRAMLIATLLIVCLLATAGTARAVELVDTGKIPADQVIDDDVFIGGDSVVVDGTVNGDLFAAGNTITINGKVKGSLFTTGQTIVINGEVDGSLYGASTSLVFGEEAEVGRNLYYAGFGLESKAGSKVGRDLLLVGYQGILGGEVSRDVMAGVGALELNGKVGRNVDVDVSEPQAVEAMQPFFGPPGMPAQIKPGLRVASGAEIGGKLIYTSPADQSQAIQVAPAGGVVYHTPQPGETTAVKPTPTPAMQAGKFVLARLRDLVTLLVLGALALWLIPAVFNQVTEKLRSEPLPSAGYGFVTVIVGYALAGFTAILILMITIVFGMITLGGLAQTVAGVGFSSLSLVVTVFTLLVSYGSKLVFAFLVGKLTLEKVAPQVASTKAWPLVVGVVLYLLVRSIPVLGWLFGVAATVLGLGAMWLWFRRRNPELAPVEAA